jgi:hypothetical protein
MTFKDWNSSIYENGIHHVANIRLGLEFCYLFSAENSDKLGQQKIIITSTDVACFPEFSIVSVGSRIGIINTIASAAAYILTWIGTVMMLYLMS